MAYGRFFVISLHVVPSVLVCIFTRSAVCLFLNDQLNPPSPRMAAFPYPHGDIAVQLRICYRKVVWSVRIFK